MKILIALAIGFCAGVLWHWFATLDTKQISEDNDMHE